MTDTTSKPTITTCPYCNGFHTAKCPLVKSFEYHENGAVKRVEFYAPKDYMPSQTIHPLMNPWDKVTP